MIFKLEWQFLLLIMSSNSGVFAGYKVVWNHLVLLPGPEEVHRSILSPLDDRPPSLSATLLAPRLQESVGALWAEQIDPTGGLTRFQHMLAISPRP